MFGYSAVSLGLAMLLMRPHFLLLLLFDTTHGGIQITDIFVPKLRMVGDDAELECRFVRSNGVRVYSIKWWRDNDQFYQYIPRNDPPKMPFNVTGIIVDISLSSEVRVILRHVTVETSGAFTCEVMADESFETVRHSDNMTVIDPPDGQIPGTLGPVIEVSGIGAVESAPLEYNVGKTLEALCIARKAYPPAVLSWKINGREAAEEFLTMIHPRQDSKNSFTTQLWLTFTVTEGLFDKEGELTLLCNASLGPLYHRHASLRLHNPMARRARNSGLFSSGFSPKHSVDVIATSLLIFLIANHADLFYFISSQNDSSALADRNELKRNVGSRATSRQTSPGGNLRTFLKRSSPTKGSSRTGSPFLTTSPTNARISNNTSLCCSIWQ